MTENDGKGMGFLKLVMRLGGGYEIAMGLVMIFFIGSFFPLLGAEEPINYMMFPWNLGVLAVCFGIMLILSARDPERYVLVPLVTILLRVLIQFPIIAGAVAMPDMALPLIGFGAFDLAFAAITAFAIHRSGIDWKNW